MKVLNIGMIFLFLVALLVISGVFYTVDETQQAVITQFGKLIGEPKTESGLYFKLPWQTANYFDKRILQWDGDANQFPTGDKRFIWVDTTARWRIADPLKFMQSVRSELSAQTRLDDILDASTRDIVSSNPLIEVIRNSNRLLEEGIIEKEPGASEFEQTALKPVKFGRSALADKILKRAQETMPVYGIELVDLKLKRINYNEKVRNEVFGRMIEERLRDAEKFRSQGKGRKAEIEGRISKELKEIQSEAYRKAQTIIGGADAKATQIYAEAYNNDPEFYSFVKSLESYRTTINKDTNFILTTDNQFFEQLNGQKSLP